MATPAAIESADSRVLVVWDFDWSLVNEDSDTWVVKQLGDELMPEFRRLREEESLGWNKTMNRQMRNLWQKGGGRTCTPQVSETEIRWSISRLPVFQENLEAVCLVRKAGAAQAVVSDANKFFIEEFLAHRGIRQLFNKGVATNPATFTEDGRLDVQPYHSESEDPHGCTWCPSNMCKGRILDGMLAVKGGSDERAADKVIYIGDGQGDFCPALRMRSGDLLLAREGVEGGRSFALLARIREGKGVLTCRLKTWKHGLDIYSALEDELRHLL